MGTQGVQMKGVLPWLVSWACRAGSIDFCYVFAALVGPVFFPHRTLFQFLCPNAQQAGQGSCAESPVSLYVYLVIPSEAKG
jgi:hypothetical protein